ncbi:MAG: inositol monophosphatase [Candidatus Hydrothermota bacterium]|nr:MAG: inositol monophosphatase [Candidatus Hydrothermae bacterium]
MKEFLEVALKAAELGGEVLLRHLGKLTEHDAVEKRRYDFVTFVDMESERTIKDFIKSKFPDHKFLAEESGGEEVTDKPLWIIDPLDGTKNYLHAFPHFGISIALKIEGEVRVGVIHDPLKKDMFWAVKGEGAFYNGRRTYIIDVEDIGHSLVATGFPFRAKDMLDTYLRAFRQIFLKAAGVRRAGSAALDLAYVAAGIFQGFFEFGLAIWDIAAGALIVREAGGIVSDFLGGQKFLETGNIIAGTPNIYPFILEVVSKTFGQP